MADLLLRRELVEHGFGREQPAVALARRERVFVPFQGVGRACIGYAHHAKAAVRAVADCVIDTLVGQEASGDHRIYSDVAHQVLNPVGIDLAAFAGAWVLANPMVAFLIAAPRTLAQWRGYLAALSTSIGQEDEDIVDQITPTGTTAIPQFIDPACPVEGRPISHR